jgi:ParB family transcriptional regulator, chromosome partitioning protein
MAKPNKNSGFFAATIGAVDKSNDNVKDNIIADLQRKLANADGTTASEVDIDLIDPSPYQCRTYFDEQELEELMASIRDVGVITPVILRVVGERYELIAGDRRRICCQRLGKTTVPSRILADVSDDQAAKLVLIENLKRSEISPIEEVRSVLALIVRAGLPGYDNADKIVSALKLIKVVSSGKSKVSLTDEQEKLSTEAKLIVDGTTKHKWDSFLSHRLPLVDLPIFLQDMVIRGLEYTKAKLLAKVSKAVGEKEGQKIAQKAVKDKLSLSVIRNYLPESSNKKDKDDPHKNKSHSYELISTQVQDIKSYCMSGIDLSTEEFEALENLIDSLKEDLQAFRRTTLSVSSDAAKS